MEGKHPITDIKVQGPRRHPELDRYKFWITVSNPQGVCKVFYYEHRLDDDNDISKEDHFIKQIVEYADVEVGHEDIHELIYIMRCVIFQDPI